MTELSVSASTTIDAPPSRVFAILADPRRHPEIDGPGTVHSVTDGPARLHLGARFGAGMRLFGAPYKVRNKVVEFDDGSVIAWRHIAPHRWRYELAPTADGRTDVTETWDTRHYPGLTALWLKVGGYPERNRKGMEATLVKLKALAESAGD